MEMTDELMEKYFEGKTSIAEENFLKEYFASSAVDAKYLMYRDMFVLYALEAEEKPVRQLVPIVESGRKDTVRFWIKMFSYSGIAATLLLMLWVRIPESKSDYAFVSGRRVEDSEYAQKYAEKKLEKVDRIIRSSMKPMRSFELVRRSLDPVRKIERTKMKVDDIQRNAE